MNPYEDLPVLLVERSQARTSVTMEASVNEIAGALESRGLTVMRVDGSETAELEILSHPELGCVLLEAESGGVAGVLATVRLIQSRTDHLPVFVLTESLSMASLPIDGLGSVQGTIWANEDTPAFIAGRVAKAVDDYLSTLYPPFFGQLVRYVDSYRYAWHTPGHMGGLAFRRSPVGRRFFDFFGENVFRADLSSSVPELGSILEHDGVVADAETEAARVFGAERTWFVTNGTTMSNQVVFRGTVRTGDVVVLDRNCHKSILNAVIQTGAIPIWLEPVRNAHGMIGPVRPSELDTQVIGRKVASNPLIGDGAKARLRLAVLTNSTYDGTMYDTGAALDRLNEVVPIVLFDEAWIPYAPFHPLFAGHFAMAPHGTTGEEPTVFATSSTHKMLASFSQGSMIHLRQGRLAIDPVRFNEAFMMHASTSPQYNIVASLDVATRMMEGAAGRALMGECVREALAFRQEVIRVRDQMTMRNGWFFQCWQPDMVAITSDVDRGTSEAVPFEDVALEALAAHQHIWQMTPGRDWHGFPELVDGYTMLDPTKVSLIAPGIEADGSPTSFGVPAALVARFLHDRDIVVEKTGFYSVLFLFSIASTRGKATTLLSELLEFTRLIDANAPIADALPTLLGQHEGRYEGLGLADLAGAMHRFLSEHDTAKMQEAIYHHFPAPVLSPTEAFNRLVDGDVDLVPLEKLDGRVSATLCVLYPPGIPVIVPGERFDQAVHPIVDYLQVFEQWADMFPGFENEMQGVVTTTSSNGRPEHGVYCVTGA